MKRILILLAAFAGLFLLIGCEKMETKVIEDPPASTQEYAVPEVPAEIAELMSKEDMIKFEAGPGSEYTRMVETRSMMRPPRYTKARWHPILMRMRYDAQFAPIGGSGCNPGEWQVCIDPDAPADCLNNVVGFTGQTEAYGRWLGKNVHSLYWPVFCALSNYDGYGTGYYELNNGMLFYEADHEPVIYDDDQNSKFYRYDRFSPNQSNGVFTGARGWSITIVRTAAENNPANHPEGKGYSDVIHYGWVYF